MGVTISISGVIGQSNNNVTLMGLGNRGPRGCLLIFPALDRLLRFESFKLSAMLLYDNAKYTYIHTYMEENSVSLTRGH